MDWKDKNVLITGITGFVGSSVARMLVARGARVVGLVHNKKRVDLGILDRCDIVYGDITDYDCLRGIISRYEIDTVFHFAAYSIVRISARDPMTTYNVNVMGTVNLLEAIRNVGTTVRRIVVASSDKAYGDIEIPYRESQLLDPTNTYDTSKACMDMISRTYALNYDMPIVVTRCSNIYGPGDTNLSRLIPNTIRRIFNGEAPTVYEDVARMEREFIHIADVVSAYDLLGTEELHFSSYNIGGTGEAKILTVIQYISDLMGYKGEPIIVPRDNVFREIMSQSIDSTRLQNDVGWSWDYDLVSGLQDTINHYVDFFETGEVLL